MVWIRKRRRRVTLHTKDEQTVEGFWDGVFRGHYVIEKPALVESEDRTVNMGGRLEVPKDNVRFVQVHD